MSIRTVTFPMNPVKHTSIPIHLYVSICVAVLCISMYGLFCFHFLLGVYVLVVVFVLDVPCDLENIFRSYTHTQLNKNKQRCSFIPDVCMCVDKCTKFVCKLSVVCIVVVND